MQATRIAVEEAGEGVGCCGGDSSDEGGLEGAAEPAGAYEFSFECSEDGQGYEGDDDGELEGFDGVVHEHVGKQRDEAAGDVGGGDGEGGAVGAVGGGFFEAEFEAHHEVDPGGGVALERGEDGGGALAVDGVLLEDLVDLFFFVVGAFDDLALFALTLGDVVLGVSASGEVAAEAHGDGAGGDFGESGEDDDAGGGDGSGESGGESEGDGEAVGEADDDVANGFGGLEVAFGVRVVAVGCERRWGGFGHGGSVVQRRRRCWEERGSFLAGASFAEKKRLYQQRV